MPLKSGDFKPEDLHLRVVTFNAWHGLDSSRPLVLFPVQKISAILKRFSLQAVALKALLTPSAQRTDILCLQELNPVFYRVTRLERVLKMRGVAAPANAGVRVGFIGYPFFLYEGLGTFISGGIKKIKSSVIELSGHAINIPFQNLLRTFVQFSERRIAQKSRLKIGGLHVCVINLHLHNGPDEGSAFERRKKEIARLVLAVKKEMKRSDVVIVCGDFNTGFDSVSLRPLKELGFKTNVKEHFTWAPKENRFCKHTLKAEKQADYSWDLKAKQLDYIFYHVSGRGEATFDVQATFKRVLDSNRVLSDHFGMQMDLYLKQRASIG